MAETGEIRIQRELSAFGDLRGWIDALKREGELHEIDAEVDWDVEIGSIIRMARCSNTQL